MLTYVRNITDIDDKIIRRAAEHGVTPSELTERVYPHMNDDFAELGSRRRTRSRAPPSTCRRCCG